MEIAIQIILLMLVITGYTVFILLVVPKSKTLIISLKDIELLAKTVTEEKLQSGDTIALEHEEKIELTVIIK